MVNIYIEMKLHTKEEETLHPGPLCQLLQLKVPRMSTTHFAILRRSRDRCRSLLDWNCSGLVHWFINRLVIHRFIVNRLDSLDSHWRWSRSPNIVEGVFVLCAARVDWWTGDGVCGC